MDYFNDVLSTFLTIIFSLPVQSLPPFLRVPLNEVVALLSLQGQKALRFYQNDLNLCPEDEQRS